jgi:hypothetical protein
MKTKILIAALSIGLFTMSTVKAQEKAIMMKDTMKMDHSKMKMMVKSKEIDSIYTCPMHADVKSDKSGACPKCGMDLKKVEMKMDHSKMKHEKMSKTYACPMHANVKSDKPGSCPKCGMELKKMELKKENII